MKDLIELAEKIGWPKAILILFLFTVVTSAGGGFWYGNQRGLSNQTNTTNIQVAGAADALNTGFYQGDKMCTEKEFKNYTADWLFSEYNKPDEDGFYCVDKRSDFSSPEIWNRYPVPANFRSIKITFEIKDKTGENKKPPSFIFSVGQIPRLLRFYIPETLPQVVGFEKIDLSSSSSNRTLMREDSDELRDPIKDGTQTELMVKSLTVNGNIMQYTFNVKYISDQTSNTEEDSFNYEVKLPFTDTSSKVSFGIGTFKGDCLKPIKYEICE